MDRILRLPARGQPPHESLSSQPSHCHGKLGGKSAAEDRTVQAFPDLSAQNTIISEPGSGAKRMDPSADPSDKRPAKHRKTAVYYAGAYD